MNDDEYELHRNRAILAAFQTGRPVFADNEGELRFVDGVGEPVPADVGIVEQPSRADLARRAERASRLTYALSTVAALANAVMAHWNTWQLAPAIVFGGCAIIWYRINRHQRAVLARDQEGA